MTDVTRDPWRTNALEAFGTQLRLVGERRAPPIRTRRRTGIAVAVAAPVAAVVTAVALLAGGGAAQASSPVSRAAGAATSAGSVLFSSSTTVELHGRLVTSSTEVGAIDFAHSRLRAFIGAPGGHHVIERRTVDGTFYAAGSTGTGPRRWIAIPRPSDSLRLPGDEALTDPTALLHAMSTTAARPRVIGSAVIDGATTTGYAVTVRLGAFLPNGSPPAGLAREPVKLTVWIDGAGRPRRATEVLIGAATGGRLTTQMQFSGFGADVAVRAPTTNVLRAAAGTSLPDVRLGVLSYLVVLGRGVHVTAHPLPALPTH